MKKKYQIFTKRFRPQRFCEVVGQEAVITTLKNSIRLKRIANAYLFSGTRGIGKTTLARLFAKALNCQSLQEDQEPCNQCSNCKEITSARSLDVIEIDGASNRGIDDIRQINETIGYMPSSSTYKIYIIDEVHMLTKEAFNALLKTLEEPPEVTKFFLATTEPHKIPPTIISRCQRFDLLQIPADLIEQTLASITKEQQREVDEEAIHLIARFADGSLRDAELILDQILCFEENKVTAKTITQMLGLIPYQDFFEIDQAIQKEDLAFAFYFVNKMIRAGKDLSLFVEELIDHFRRIFLIKLNKQSLLHLPTAIHNTYLERARLYDEEQCLFILDSLAEALHTVQKSPFKRIALESLLLKIIRSNSHIPLPALVRRLNQLEQSFHPSAEKKSSEPLEEIALEKIPFSFTLSSSQEEPAFDLLTKREGTSRSDQDTLMRFAAVEFKGNLKIDS